MTTHVDDHTGRCPVDAAAITAAVAAAAAHRSRLVAQISVAVLDDESLRAINRDHLGHDWTTDVCTFPYLNPAGLEGEIFVSLDTAAREAADRGAAVGEELILYVVHGVLHLAGLDDHDPSDRAAMRAAERDVLATLGIDIDRFA